MLRAAHSKGIQWSMGIRESSLHRSASHPKSLVHAVVPSNYCRTLQGKHGKTITVKQPLVCSAFFSGELAFSCL